MAALLTWELYSSLHNKVTEEEFEAAEAKAEKQIRAVIGPVRWAGISADTPYYDVLLDCIAETIDHNKDLEGTELGKGVQSVSNDGYSVNFSIEKSTDLDDENKALIKRLLSGTGLVGAY